MLTSQAEILPGLLPHHLVALRKRGLADDIVRAAKISSETSLANITAILDCKTFPQRCLPAIVIPFVDADGHNGYTRIRPDNPRTSRGKSVKYESPHGQPNRAYFPPGVAEVLPDPKRELLITESEFKALAATQEGFPCVGLVGIWGWKRAKHESLLPSLARIALKDRPVYIVFDSDVSTKPEVQDAESRLAAHLTQHGAKVKVARLRPGEPGPDGKPTKIGLDDFVAACRAKGLNPAGEIRKLLDAAEDPSPPEAGELKQAASEIDPIPEALAFLAQSERDGVPRLRFYRGGFLYWRGGAYHEMPPSEVRGRLIDHLDRGFCKLSSAAISNVLDGLRAKARLAHHIEPPAWIGENAPAWDSDDVLICRNGLIHLPSLVAGKPDFRRPTTPRLFALNAVDYDFTVDAPRPSAWLEFLSQLWPDDAGSVSALQEWAGLLLTPNTRHQKIMLAIGPRRSGKGTISRVFRAMIGPANVCGPTLASLAQNFGLWPLIGKSLAIFSDTRLGNRTDGQVVVERLLSISGEDALTIDRKNLEPLTVKLPTRLMIFSNELPRLGDSSGALAGRMILLRLNRSFFGCEDSGLTDRLLVELPGILLWAIDGWRRLRERGRFVQPTAADELLSELNDLGSPVSVFIRDCCDTGPECDVSRGNLYDAYAAWAKGHGRTKIEDEAGFGRALRAALPSVGTVQHRDCGGPPVRHYSGLRLKTL